jgi:hypothetical protein
MNRGLWFVAGAGAGIYAVIRGRRAAEAVTAEGLHDRMEALFLGARLFRDEVAQGAAVRETELRERFGVLPHERASTPQLETPVESRGQH